MDQLQFKTSYFLLALVIAFFYIYTSCYKIDIVKKIM
jgi:hypothetical protein